MQAMFDDEGEWSAGIYVLCLDGAPYAAFVGSGENEAGSTSFLVTDENLHKQAVAIAKQWRKRPRLGVFVGGDFDLRSVRIVDGIIASSPGGFRLVDNKFAGKDGTLLFDEMAFRESFRNGVSDPVKANRDLDWILANCAGMVAAAIPDGIARVVVNAPPRRTPRRAGTCGSQPSPGRMREPTRSASMPMHWNMTASNGGATSSRRGSAAPRCSLASPNGTLRTRPLQDPDSQKDIEPKGTVMKPNDVYAMPSLRTEPLWFAPESMVEEAFGIKEWDFDDELMRQADDQRIQCHRKMEYHLGDENSSTVYALTLEDKPFGIFIKAGYQGQHMQFIPTEENLFMEAIGIVNGWRKRSMFNDVVDPSAELNDLTFFHETAAVRTEEGFRLIDIRFVDNAGTIIFDEKRFLSAFREFGNTLKDIPHDERKGIDWVKEQKAAIISKAVPEHLRSVTVNETKQNPASLNLWIATVVGTDEGTYAIGIHENLLKRSDFISGSNITTEWLGGPDLFVRYAEKYGAGSPSPKP